MKLLSELRDSLPEPHRSQSIIRGYALEGNPTIHDVAGIYGGRFSLGFIDDAYNKKHPTWYVGCRLGAAVMPPDTFHNLPDYALPRTTGVVTSNPRLVFAYMAQPFLLERRDAERLSVRSDIHPDAGIHEGVIIGRNVSIGPDVVIETGTIISPGAVIDHARIGENVYIGANVVIGGPGFGYVIDDELKTVVTFPHVGCVIIKQDAAVLAGTCVCRGSLQNTLIAQNAKIDQLCHIAHNCYIGENALVVANTTLGGSTKVHDYAWVGTSTTTLQGTAIGWRGMTGAAANVLHDVDDETIHVGNPAKFLRNRKEGE